MMSFCMIMIINKFRNFKQKIRYETVQKRVYAESSEIMSENCEICFHDVVNACLINNDKRMPTFKTFIKYRPNFVCQHEYLKKIACDTCTQFEFYSNALIKALLKLHKWEKLLVIIMQLSLRMQVNAILVIIVQYFNEKMHLLMTCWIFYHADPAQHHTF